MKIFYLTILNAFVCLTMSYGQNKGHGNNNLRTDRKSPQVVSISRQVPLTTSTSAPSVVFRIIFNEKVSGVSPTDFTVTTTSGSVNSSIASNAVVSVGTVGTTYDVAVSSLSGNGTFRLDLKSSGTGIVDEAGNNIKNGFTSGESYTYVAAAAPTLTSVSIASNNAISSLAKPGNTVTLNFTASVPVNTPSVTITGKTVTIASTGGNSFTASYTMLSTDATGVVPFTINFTSTTGVAGNQVTTTTNGSQVTFDKIAPLVSSINRQQPLSETTSGSSVTFRVTFNEKVTGLDATDLAVTTISGTVGASIASNAVVAVGTAGTTYDVTVSSLSGAGSFRLDLKSSGTNIADAAGNVITTGYTSGQGYTLTTSTSPTLSSVTIASNNPTISLAKPGDVVTLNFTASVPVNTPVVTIAGKSVTVTSTGTNSYAASYTMLSTDATGVVPFTINFTSTSGVAGSQVTTTTNGSKVTFDKTAPVVSGINRQLPFTETTAGPSVTFRVSFNEKVTGVDATDFVITTTSGTVGSSIASNAVVAVGTAGTTYDVTVSSLSGGGSFRLDLKGSGTAIKDAAGNAITTGFTAGQNYTLSQPVTQPGFKSITRLNNVGLGLATKDKPQAKAWTYAGKWWCVLSATGGTKIFRLDGTSWTEILLLSTSNTKPDCWVSGDLVHLLLYKGASNNSFVYSVKYDVATSTYKLWSTRPTAVTLVFPAGSETARILVDGSGRMWAASDGVSDITVRWSDAPYSSWSAPITIASGVKDDDICTLASMPGLNKIGVFWSNQTTKKFGFRTHTNGTDPTSWTADETPAAQSAIANVGVGMADDHMNLKVANDGTVYVAAKTGYDATGYAKLILLVRRPNGTWDNQYTVTVFPDGTQPLLVFNEAKGLLKVIYTTVENGGEIRYSQSPISNIAFGPSMPLITSPGVLYNYSTSTHQNYSSNVVIIATDMSAVPNQAVSILASDDDALIATIKPERSVLSIMAPVNDSLSTISAFPNPIGSNLANIRFTLEKTSNYKLALFDSKGTQLRILKKGHAKAGETNTATIDGSLLTNGIYLVQLNTGTTSQTIKLVVKK
ncbi:MAG: T9SS type A sorting domain-containing protein [Bacteroidota bacterium]